jgi:hypothetical protein
VLTLGYVVAEWIAEFLPLPAAGGRIGPFDLTPEQVRFLARWYSIADDEFRYRRGALMQAKGWGKSPLAAAIALAEFVGPVVFDGLDAERHPVGVPRGILGSSPWIQIAAVSEGQAVANCYSLIWEMLGSNGGKAADALEIDLGKTRLELPAQKGAKLEAVSSSAGARAGQRTSFVVMDESHNWHPGNRGIALATILRANCGKSGGRSLETSNAYEVGLSSVAERTAAEKNSEGVLYVANSPHNEPTPDMSDEEILEALEQVYGDARWINRRRVLREIRDPGTEWSEAVRLYLNVPSAGGGSLIDPQWWADLVAEGVEQNARKA